jgi:crotonobetainyl-CoA:carnitine CoA-transferase CaiB-like acyl-CoA transferase
VSPLSDLHVVEVTDVLAGPLAGAIVAAMGATVVRAEDRERLDTYRRNGPFAGGEPGTERAAYFMAANYNKLSVADSLSHEPSLASDLMSWADVLLENVGSRRLARLGFDGFVSTGEGGVDCSVSVSGFGRSGPHSHYRAYAWNVHSYAGLADAVAKQAGPEFLLRSPLADYCAAIWAATFVVAWWLGDSHDQARVDLSMAEVTASKLLTLRDDDPAASSPSPSSCDLVVPVGDGRFLAATTSDLRHLLSVLGAHDADPASDTQAATVDALTAAATEAADATVETLQKAGIATYLTQTPATLLDDGQVRARDFFPEVEHPVLGRSQIIALPWKEAGRPRDWYRRAPLFGEADAEIRQILAGTAT